MGPVLVGSAGTAGARSHLDRTVRIVRRLAERNGWHFPLAVIDSELDPEQVVAAYQAGTCSDDAAGVDVGCDTCQKPAANASAAGPVAERAGP